MKNILLVTFGYFGRGATIEEAYGNIIKAGSPTDKKVVLMVGKTELVFHSVLNVEGQVIFAMTFPTLRALNGSELKIDRPLTYATD